MLRLDALQAFVSVADARGFALAARRLGISPSAATRLVASLEEQLGVRLLQRTTRAVSLTDAGRRYLERARRILADVAEAEQVARAEQTEPTGRFVVAAPTVFGRREVAPLMCEFLARHPRVVGELTLSDRLVNLVEEGVDLAVRIGHLGDSSLVAKRVCMTRRVAVAAPSYVAARKRPRAPEELSEHTTIHCTALASSPEWTFTRGESVVRVAIQPSFITNSVDAAIEHAELGGGITLVLAYQVIGSVQAGRLQVLLKSFEPPPLPIQLVYPSGRLLSASARVFSDMAAKRSWRFTSLE
jgi:DNA-binding transcriptional LysR family regulator